MTILDFPNTPTVGQTYTAPNGAIYTWDGAAWTVTGSSLVNLWQVAGSALTPVDPTKAVTLSPIEWPLVWSPGAIKSRARGVNGALQLTCNTMFNGSVWVQDDPSKSSWAHTIDPFNDRFVVQRQPAGSPSTITSLLTLDASGNTTITGNYVAGTGTIKGALSVDTAGALYLFANNPYAPQDATKASWMAYLNPVSDVMNITRRAPNAGAGATTAVLTLDANMNMTLAGNTATKASGTTWANPSDIRIKKNITDYTPGLDAILALRPIRFEHNGVAGTTNGAPGISFIADEVESIMPEMVGTQRAKLQPDDDEDTDLKTLDVSPMLFAFVNAFKELAARVAALET